MSGAVAAIAAAFFVLPDGVTYARGYSVSREDKCRLERGQNEAPHLDSVSIPATATVGQAFSVTGRGWDDDSDTIELSWSFGDGSDQQVLYRVNNQVFATSHVFEEPGLYTVSLTASDGCKAAMYSRDVAVEGTATAGLAFTWLPSTPMTGQRVRFTATLGPDVVSAYMWWFNEVEIDGTNHEIGPLAGWGTGRNFEKVFTEAGTYLATLAVQKHNGDYVEESFPLVVELLPPMEIIDLLDGSDGNTAGLNLTVDISEGPQPGYRTAWLGNTEGVLTTIEIGPQGHLRHLSSEDVCTDEIVQVVARDGKILIACNAVSLDVYDANVVEKPFRLIGGYDPQDRFDVWGAELVGDDLYVVGLPYSTGAGQIRRVNLQSGILLDVSYEIPWPRDIALAGGLAFVAGRDDAGPLVCAVRLEDLEIAGCNSLFNTPLEVKVMGDLLLVAQNDAQLFQGVGVIDVFKIGADDDFLAHVSRIAEPVAAFRDVEVVGQRVYASTASRIYRFEPVAGSPGQFALLDSIVTGGNVGFMAGSGEVLVAALDFYRLAVSLKP